jgi:hypothetical protein
VLLPPSSFPAWVAELQVHQKPGPIAIVARDVDITYSFLWVYNGRALLQIHISLCEECMGLRKTIARLLLPTSAFERVQAVRSRRHQMRLLKREGLIDTAKRYIDRNGSTVKYGPFAGTVYPLEAALSRHSIPKLLGTYEQELHGILHVIEQRKYDLVIDIGSAEGYYAVGLARMLRTKVLAYDPEPTERSHCERSSRLNGVSSLVEMRGLFQQADIQNYRDLRVLCVCDCEGFESQLFDSTSIQDVAKWDLLIELHGDTAEHLPRLRWPHEASLISSTHRNETYPELDGLGDQSRLLSEWRSASGQTWIWCDGSGS